MSAFALGLSVRTQHGARDRRLEQVKAEERVQLARELHDTVAHHVSAIAIQAQAGRALAATSPSSSLEALEVIEVEASRTLAEMRAMVRVLRNEAPADYAPQPGVADLERLVAAHAGRAAGGGDALRRPDRAPRGGGRGRLPDRAGGSHQRPAPCPERDTGRRTRRR